MIIKIEETGEEIDTDNLTDKLLEVDDIEEERGELLTDVENEIDTLSDKLELSKWIGYQYSDESNIIKDISENYSMNLSEAQKHISSYPNIIKIDDQSIPELVKSLRLIRRKLKGQNRTRIEKTVDHLINAHQEHIQKCLNSIYWLSPYQSPLKKMTINEKMLKQLYSVKDGNTREKIIDCLCKMWEATIEIKETDYGPQYSELSKQIQNNKKEIRSLLREIPHQTIRKSRKELLGNTIMKIVCDNPGSSSNKIHALLPKQYHRVSTPQIIAKQLRRLNITNIEGEYYAISNEIKKDLYSYVAGFIDSDGYITMDANKAPRVGMIATGNRGKAFFQELYKELKVGRLHLDQKVGENSRSQHRLNFYSQGDIYTLLNKCMPHLRMKQTQAELLMEAIRIKKTHKKQTWSKPRLEEIFKLMKYENWKDARNKTEFIKYDINVDDISKFQRNNKMELMDEIEKGGVE